MISDEFVDTTLANLKVIGMVPQNGRLCVRKGQLCLDTDGRMQPVRRWLRGDSRDSVLLHVRTTIGNAIRLVGYVGGEAAPPNLACWTAGRIVDEMRQCEAGLRNLRVTYAGDSLMVANLDVLTERLKAHHAALGAAASASAAPLQPQQPAAPAPADGDAAPPQTQTQQTNQAARRARERD